MEPYEVFGHVFDFYRLAHVKEEYFAPFSLTAGLKNEEITAIANYLTQMP